MSSSFLVLFCAFDLKIQPSRGIDERYGIPVSVSVSESTNMPPITVVSPFFTTSSVVASFLLIGGGEPVPAELGCSQPVRHGGERLSAERGI